MSDYVIRLPSHLGPLLRAFRRKAGLSQAALAERLGVSQQAIAQLERKPQSASWERLVRTLHALGVEVVLRDGEARS